MLRVISLNANGIRAAARKGFFDWLDGQPQDGRCVEDNCRGVGCPPGEICDVVALECVADPCETASCAADEVCRRGTCEPSCAGVDCPMGESCASGVCVEDLCADVECADGSVCNPDDGT